MAGHDATINGGTMGIEIVILSIWAILMVRSVVAEYQYYQAVKRFEPAILTKLGAPKWFRVPMVFVSSSGIALLRSSAHETVRAYAKRHRQAGRQFLSYVVLVLVLSIAYFKFA